MSRSHLSASAGGCHDFVNYIFVMCSAEPRNPSNFAVRGRCILRIPKKTIPCRALPRRRRGDKRAREQADRAERMEHKSLKLEADRAYYEHGRDDEREKNADTSVTKSGQTGRAKYVHRPPRESVLSLISASRRDEAPLFWHATKSAASATATSRPRLVSTGGERERLIFSTEIVLASPT